MLKHTCFKKWQFRFDSIIDFSFYISYDLENTVNITKIRSSSPCFDFLSTIFFFVSWKCPPKKEVLQPYHLRLILILLILVICFWENDADFLLAYEWNGKRSVWGNWKIQLCSCTTLPFSMQSTLARCRSPSDFGQIFHLHIYTSYPTLA